jgi:antitoxin ParD1/3/4
MNVNLTPELEQLIQDKVATGLYASQSEVVREALRLLVEQDERKRDQLIHLREALAEGLQQAERGQLLDGAALAAELRERYGGAEEGKPRPRKKRRSATKKKARSSR